MIARICLLSLCLALAACSDPYKSTEGQVLFTRLDDCMMVLRPAQFSDFKPMVVIKDTPECLNPASLAGKPAGHGMSYPEAEPPRADKPYPHCSSTMCIAGPPRTD